MQLKKHIGIFILFISNNDINLCDRYAMVGALLFGHQYQDMSSVRNVACTEKFASFTKKYGSDNISCAIIVSCQLSSSYQFLAFTLVAFEPQVMYAQV
jgi:hypothetical protein